MAPLRARRTFVHCRFLAVSAVCICWIAMPAAAARFSRWRKSVGSTHTSSRGRKRRWSSPKAGRFCSHRPSSRSLWRPGQLRARRASPRGTAQPRASSTGKSAIQETPVDSRATVCTPQAASPPANRGRPAVKLPNQRTGSGSQPAGTATQCAALPAPRPAAWGSSQGRPLAGSAFLNDFPPRIPRPSRRAGRG